MSEDKLSGTMKELIIEIEPSRMVRMKEQGYKLCFAKKVGDEDYNVVWQAYDEMQYYQVNEFSWVQKYQIFGANTFQHGVKPKVVTNVSAIGLGQTCTLNANMIMFKAADGGDKLSLNLNNEYGDIRIGINQICTDANGDLGAFPIYVSAKTVKRGSAAFMQKELVLVWFETDLNTGDIFTSPRSCAREVDFTTRNTARLIYDGNGLWHEG